MQCHLLTMTNDTDLVDFTLFKGLSIWGCSWICCSCPRKWYIFTKRDITFWNTPTQSTNRLLNRHRVVFTVDKLFRVLFSPESLKLPKRGLATRQWRLTYGFERPHNVDQKPRFCECQLDQVRVCVPETNLTSCFAFLKEEVKTHTR